MKDLKRKIHYWCSDTMQNKITGKGVVCAVLDTGITQHPDLVGRIVGWKDCVQGKKTIYDDNGHGTHVEEFLPEMEKAEEVCTAEWHRRRRSLLSRC